MTKNLIWQQSFATGGGNTFVSRIVDFSLFQGFSTYLICNDQQEKWYIRPSVEIVKSQKLSRVYLGKGLLRKTKNLVEEIIALREEIKRVKPDVITVSNIAEGTQLAAFLTNIPIIYFVHSYPLGNIDLMIGKYLKINKRKKYRIATVSNYSARKVENYFGLQKGFVRVVYNYAKTVNSIGSSRDKPFVTILTVGNVIHYKNPELWLDLAKTIIAKHKNVKFVWAGEGALLEAFISETRKEKYNGRIQFVGHQSDLSHYYENADIYFQPSAIESHGIAVVEAMSYALPCVVSDVGGLPESVQHEVTGFVNKIHDENQFVKNLLTLVEDVNLRKTMGEKGRKKAMDSFSKKEWTKSILACYEEVLT